MATPLLVELSVRAERYALKYPNDESASGLLARIYDFRAAAVVNKKPSIKDSNLLNENRVVDA